MSEMPIEVESEDAEYIRRASASIRDELEHFVIGAQLGPCTCGTTQHRASVAVELVPPQDMRQIGRCVQWQVRMREKNGTTFLLRLDTFMAPGQLGEIVARAIRLHASDSTDVMAKKKP